ncbi:hypothetical protein VZT92_022544 [Zoarces viviparus]|uniref:Uncharacterized protein n=1 Tax=Zoarces viviparus TaxID=48416 RepID=A0AAW1EBP1_ZOAVI
MVQFLGVNGDSVSAVLRLCSPPRVLVRSQGSVSCEGIFLGRERRSHTLEILEPRLLSHSFLAHMFTLTRKLL